MTVADPVPDWTSNFRRLVKQSTGSGWNVFPRRGRMRLQVRDEAGRAQSITLPYPWEEASVADALLRIRVIYQAYAAGDLTLAAASWQAETCSSKATFNWRQAYEAFRHQRTVVEGRVGPRTWRVKYEPVLQPTLMAMEGSRTPQDGPALCEVILGRWQAGTRQRQIMRQNLAAFLRYCVERQGFKRCWMPPPAVGEKRLPKRVGYPLKDAQILKLLDELPQDQAGSRWRFALELLSVYGLRPEELRFLVVKGGIDGDELWTQYRKSKGGTQGDTTEPRCLHGLLVRDSDGRPLDWRLLERVRTGEELPPLGQEGKAGEALGTYLRRRPIWRELQREVAAQGEELTPYSFRHRYSQRAHAAGLPPKDIADAMGHTLDTHLKAYARFATRGLASAFKRINAQ
jgi:integrase